MFNNNYHSSSSSSSSSVNINVEQANVSDAARLLREMEQSIISKIPVANNEFKATMVIVQSMTGRKLQLVFLLNGVRMSSLSEPFYDETSMREALVGLTKDVAMQITEEILHGAFVDMPRDAHRMLYMS